MNFMFYLKYNFYKIKKIINQRIKNKKKKIN